MDRKRDVICLVPQSISRADLKQIRSLHYSKLAWGYLKGRLESDINLGFKCNLEYQFVIDEIPFYVKNIHRWFQAIPKKNNWPRVSDWVWEIDFENSRAVPVRQKKSNIDHLPQNMAGPVMQLGEYDLHILKRLLEKRGFLADIVAPKISLLLHGDISKQSFKKAVERLGEAVIDVNDHLIGMAKEFHWPNRGNDRFKYIVSVNDGKVNCVEV